MNKAINIKMLAFMIFMSYAALFSIESSAQEYEPWTGSVVGANIHLGTNETLISIRKLINEGKTEQAVRESQKFINQLSINSRSGQTSNYKYDAYNALCISLASNGQYEEAIKACDTAVELSSERWQAINSRGSAYYKSGNYENALRDYRSALEKAPEVDRIRKILEHNIVISEAQLSGN